MTDQTAPLSAALASKYDAYLAWLPLTDHERMLRQLPRTKTAFAESLGISARMLNKYEADPRFTARARNAGVTLEPRSARVSVPSAAPEPAPVMPEASGPGTLAPVPAATVAELEVDDELSPDENDYRAIKAKVVAGARTGDPKMTDLYMRSYGRPFIDDEVASRTAGFENLDLPELITRAMLVLGPEDLVLALTGAGWTVTPPCAPPAGADGEPA